MSSARGSETPYEPDAPAYAPVSSVCRAIRLPALVVVALIRRLTHGEVSTALGRRRISELYQHEKQPRIRTLDRMHTRLYAA